MSLVWPSLEVNAASDQLRLLNLTEWVDELFPNQTVFGGETHEKIRGVCRDVLSYTIPETRIRYWDVGVLVPNLLFFLFLLFRIPALCRRTHKVPSPTFRTFFVLIYITTIVHVTRCLFSIYMSTTETRFAELVDKILWLSLRFLFLTAELSVVALGLLYGRLDSSAWVHRMLFLTIFFSVAHTALQALFDFEMLDEDLLASVWLPSPSHGVLLLWVFSSLFFALLYVFVLCLPITCVRYYVTLPSRCAFVLYCVLLSLLNLLQAFGAALLFFGLIDGICFVDVTTVVYFTIFTPVVYFTFLRRTKSRCSVSTSSGLFSYRQQKDERGPHEQTQHTTYYPRFSGLQSPSYDDLFEACRDRSLFPHHEAPLMLADTADSTVTTRTGSDDLESRFDSLDRGPRQLKGLGANGTLVFSDDEPYPRPWGFRY